MHFEHSYPQRWHVFASQETGIIVRTLVVSVFSSSTTTCLYLGPISGHCLIPCYRISVRMLIDSLINSSTDSEGSCMSAPNIRYYRIPC